LSKNNNISFRLSDENNDKLQNLADMQDSQKSTVASNIVTRYLNENIEELIINHISYPRPVIKKLFTLLNEDQIIKLISELNNYNNGIIKSARQNNSSNKILSLLRKWLKSSGCEVHLSLYGKQHNIEIHHEMEKNWSVVTCATITYILEILDCKIKRTFVEDSWFKIEYLPD